MAGGNVYRIPILGGEVKMMMEKKDLNLLIQNLEVFE